MADTVREPKWDGKEVPIEAEEVQKTVFQSDYDSVLGLEKQKRIIRRIDYRLLPILGLMYSISLIDRTNLGLAMVAGMAEDLDLMLGSRYTIVVMTFFISYTIFEVTSNLILPKAGAANWLAFLGIAFGSILIGMGFVKHWGMLAFCRALLGIVEAGFLPGCAYLITCWYTRFEVGKRMSLFFILSCFATAFASILAYALSLLKGKGGLNGWSWIFIVEGIITVIICAVGWFMIVDFPTRPNTFLTTEETKFILDRLNADAGDAEEDPITMAVILHHLKDWKLYFWAFNFVATTLPGYAFSYFLPIILRQGMGYSSAESQLLTAPPYVLSAIIAFTSGWLGDKYRIRGPIVAFHQLCAAIGMIITVFAKGNGARYFGAFLGIGFIQFCVPGVLTFQSNNIISRSKRAVATGTCVMGGGIGGIIAGVAYKSSESPRYTTGVFTTLGVCLLSISMIAIMDLHFLKANRAMRSGQPRGDVPADWYYTY